MSALASLTDDLAIWITGLRLDAIPAAVLDRATASIVDTVGVTLAGVAEPAAQIASRVVAADGALPLASQLGTGFATSMESAAFLNGIAGHALDYDDVSFTVLGHPSVVVLPTALAVGQATGASGASVLTAYVVGVEVMAKLARTIGEDHYQRGWHATATLGTIASAAAAASLLGLEPVRVQIALSIAASSAAGLRQNFGTMTKPYHAGHANRCGINAARLAAAGFTADPTVFEGRSGFFALYGDKATGIEWLPETLGQPFALEDPGLGIKQYPCCYGTHRALDAMLGLVRETGLRASDVAQIEVDAPPGELTPLIHPRPTSGLEAKFSMEYALSAALVDGAVGLSSFRDEMVSRAPIQVLLPRIQVRAWGAETGQGLAGGDGLLTVAVKTHDGQQLRREVRHARGADQLPLSLSEVVTKFRDCAAGRLGPTQIDASIAELTNLRSRLSLFELVRALTPATASA